MGPMESRLKPLVFKACLAAAWSDKAMTPGERGHLAGLVENLSESEEDRQALRKLALEDVKTDILLSEVQDLEDTGKRILFEECLSLLKEDGKLQAADLRFLGALRRSCGIGYWAFQRRLWRLGWSEKIKMTRWRYVLLLLAFGTGLLIYDAARGGRFPEEESSKRGVLLGLGPARYQLPLSARHTPEGVYGLVEGSVVRVGVRIGERAQINGSGFVVGIDDRRSVYMVTNKHVVYVPVARGRRHRFRVRFPSGASFDAKLDFYSRNKDLALLRVDGMARSPAPLPLAMKTDLAVGQPVYALGSPIGLDHSFTAGIVSAIRDDFIQTDATATSGSSGGPLIDGYGRLCGVITKAHVHKDYSFALYADDVLDMLRERRAAFGAAAAGDAPEAPPASR